MLQWKILKEEVVSKALEHVSVMYVQEKDFVMRCWEFYLGVWRFLLGNHDKCVAYVRYYYSPYFCKNSAEDHQKRYAPLVNKFRDAFREDTNTWMVLDHILKTMLAFAINVYNGIVPDDDDTAEHVFRLIYSSSGQYFKKGESQKL